MLRQFVLQLRLPRKNKYVAVFIQCQQINQNKMSPLPAYLELCLSAIPCLMQHKWWQVQTLTKNNPKRLVPEGRFFHVYFQKFKKMKLFFTLLPFHLQFHVQLTTHILQIHDNFLSCKFTLSPKKCINKRTISVKTHIPVMCIKAANQTVKVLK